MSTPSRSKDLYAAVDSRHASPLMNAIDRELRRVHRIATAEGMVGDDDLAEVNRALGIDAGTSLIDIGCGRCRPHTTNTPSIARRAWPRCSASASSTWCS